jgi:hypothetical protein
MNFALLSAGINSGGEPPAPPDPRLMDDVTSSIWGAWGTMKLYSAYSGAALRVKDNSNVEEDIGFDGAGELDTAALLGATPYKVLTWYDQSGGGHNMTASSGAEPTLDAADKSIRFSNQQFNLGNLSAWTAGEIFIKRKIDNDPTTGGDTGTPYLFGTAGTASHIPFSNGLVYDSFGSTARKDTAVNPATSMASYHVYNVYSAASDWQNFLNGASLYSTATNTVAFSTTCQFGRRDSGFYMVGNVKAVVLANAKCNTTDRGVINAGL